jgi:uncharacterized protein (DUF2252 family)
VASIAERVKQFNSDRIPVYTLLKYQMMAANAFRFFRGTCHLFYEDLSAAAPIPPSPPAWICGDLHLENFGSYKGENRLVYFDLNDFDESILAPAAWELVRMVTSIFSAFDSLQIRPREALRMASLFLQTYSDALRKGKAHYIEPRTARGIVRGFLEQVEERRLKTLLRERTEIINSKIQLRVDNKRFFKPEQAAKKEISGQMTKWLKQKDHSFYRFRLIDTAFRIAGTGSIGVERYAFLIQNRDIPKKYVLMDMKQARPSSIQPYLQLQQPSWTSQAERVVAIQERMQNTSPALLSSLEYNGRSYVLKEMQPTADKINFEIIKNRYESIARVIEDMAILTASAQLRSAGRQGSAIADELIAFGQDGHWQQSLLDYAGQYAQQVKTDYRSYLKDYKAGYFSLK